jgi:IS605 OrfB family transposase
VKLTIKLKLQPSAPQAAALRHTLEVANQAANEISRLAWEAQTFEQFALHKLCYQRIRHQFSLSAQMTVRLIAKVAAAYQRDRQMKHCFRALGAIAFDDRILRYGSDFVSLWTTEGRQAILFACAKHDLNRLATRQGESDLCYRRGKWFLFATIEVAAPPPEAPQGVLGIDLGIVNLATDSDGEAFSGKAVKAVRHRHTRLRTRLQTKGTKSSRRRLKKLAGKERRFAQQVNHTISKRIVRKAQCTKRAIALEDLKGIRARIKARKPQRRTLHSWSFGQLRDFIEYKAKLAGVVVVAVDPRNTSRECPRCGHTAKENRPEQARFSCQSCGYAAPADYIAATNVRGRAAIDQPHVSDLGYKPRSARDDYAYSA